MPPRLDQVVGAGYASQAKSKHWSIIPSRRRLLEVDYRKELPVELVIDHLSNPNNPLPYVVDKKLKTALILQYMGKEQIQSSRQPRLIPHSI